MENKKDRNGRTNAPAVIDTMSVNKYRHEGKQMAQERKKEEEKELGLAPDPDDSKQNEDC